MATPLKDLYSKPFYEKLCTFLSEVLPDFSSERFLKSIFTNEFKNMELKQRMWHTSDVLHQFLSGNYEKDIEKILKLIELMQKNGVSENSLEYMFLPEYISNFGLEFFEVSVQAIETVTQFTSCEFAVRPFIVKYDDRMLQQMLTWSKHANKKVRRLASEGSRPRLPWAIALPKLKKDPTPILAILENMKNDPCEVVRRSVANSLNDISKDNPQILTNIAKKWLGKSTETDAIVKHACRTMLKSGNKEILQMFQLESSNIVFDDFSIITPTVNIGEIITFTFRVENTKNSPQKIRIEYAMYFKKANGSLTKKVFKISEKLFEANEKNTVVRNHSFRLITTRKYYIGTHKVGIILNGEEYHTLSFDLM